MAVDPEVPKLRKRLILALFASSAVHTGLVLAAARGPSAPAFELDEAPMTPEAPWVGETFDIGESVAVPGGPAAAVAAGAQAEPVAQQAPAQGEPAAATVETTRPQPPAKPPPARPRKPVAARPAASAQADRAAGEGDPSSGAPASGEGRPGGMQAGGPLAPRELSRAFTRAIPIAVSGDPVWSTLPLGNAGTFDLKVVLGEDGRIATATPDRAVPPHLQLIGERTVKLLGAGTFAIRAQPGAGMQVLRIGVTLSSVESAGAEDPSQAGAYGLGYEPPRDGKPGEARFTLRSGRHVSVSVRVLGN
jgi:hypothetical protein